MTKSRNIRARRNSSLEVKLAHRSVSDRITGCILWMGSAEGGGYGQVAYRGRTLLAHRAAWMVKHGPIPAGMQVCHRCDVRNCINVDHLFLGTPLENVRDMRGKGRGPDHSYIGAFHQGELCNFAKLTADDVLAIRSSTDIQRVAAEKYGVSQQQVSRIRKHINWGHL